MSDAKDNVDRSTWATGGGLMLGLGAGFFFFPESVFGVTSVFAFTGCLLAGLGLGLFATAVLSCMQGRR